MEIKLTVGFDKKAEEILEKILNAVADQSATQNYFNVTNWDDVPHEKVEIDTPMEPKKKAMELAAPVKEEPKKEEKTVPEVDYEAVRTEAKRIGIQLSQLKKSADVKELNSRYGVKKITDLPNEKLEAYLVEIKKILEEA